MIDATKLPCVRPEVAQVAEAAQVAPVEPVEYTRAPESAGPQRTGNRPPAVQGNAR